MSLCMVHSYQPTIRPLISKISKVASRLNAQLDLVEYKAQRDSYKEKSRVFRRTVFNEEDWRKFRSSDRMFKNVSVC